MAKDYSKFAGVLGQQFQSVLGRAPTPEEIDYLGKFLSENSIQPYEVGQILQGTTEYKQTLLDKNVAKYGQALEAADQPILQRGAEIAGRQARANFAGLGRPETSAIASQVFGQTGNLAADLAAKRQNALSSFYGQGLRGNMDTTASNASSALERAYGIRDEKRNRQYALENLRMQGAMQGDLLAAQNKDWLGKSVASAALGGVARGAGFAMGSSL